MKKTRRAGPAALPVGGAEVKMVVTTGAQYPTGPSRTDLTALIFCTALRMVCTVSRKVNQALATGGDRNVASGEMIDGSTVAPGRGRGRVGRAQGTVSVLKFWVVVCRYLHLPDRWGRHNQ